MEFFEGLNEGITNVTNSPLRGLVTLVIWNYFVLNDNVTNVNNPPPRGLLTLVTWNFGEEKKWQLKCKKIRGGQLYLFSCSLSLKSYQAKRQRLDHAHFYKVKKMGGEWARWGGPAMTGRQGGPPPTYRDGPIFCTKSR
jgi:hypothetical protein